MQAFVDGFDASASQLADEIDSVGAACLKTAVTDQWLRAAQECVRSYLPNNGEHERFIEDPAAAEYPFVNRLVIDPRLESLLESLARTAYPNFNPDSDGIECAIRIL